MQGFRGCFDQYLSPVDQKWANLLTFHYATDGSSLTEISYYIANLTGSSLGDIFFPGTQLRLGKLFEGQEQCQLTERKRHEKK